MDPYPKTQPCYIGYQNTYLVDERADNNCPEFLEKG